MNRTVRLIVYDSKEHQEMIDATIKDLEKLMELPVHW